MICSKHQRTGDVERMAVCASCGHARPSRERASLAFFEDHGPSSEQAQRSCLHCHFFDCAHDPAYMSTLARGRDGSRRKTVVEDGTCPGFEPHGAWDYDTYYCGCRGWD